MAVTLGHVAGGDVAGLVAQHAGDFRLVVGQRQQATGDVDIAARHGEGVDDIGIQHGELIIDIRPVGVGGNRFADALDIGLERRIGIGTPELLEDFGVILLADLAFLGFRHESGEGRLPGCRIERAAGQPDE